MADEEIGLGEIIEAFDEDEAVPDEGTIEADSGGMPRLYPSQVARLFPADRCVSVHGRGVYMGCNASNRWVKDGELDKPIGAQSILRKEVGRFCDRAFDQFPAPKDAKKDYRNQLFTTKFREELLKELDLPSLNPDVFDGNPMLIGLDRGRGNLSAVLDLETKIIRDMRPADFITRKCTVVPDWTMLTPRFDKFLLEIMSGEVDRRDYLLRLLGYGLTGRTSEDALVFLLGIGGNGKSTLLDVLADIAGPGYHTGIRMAGLLEKAGASSDDAQKRMFARLYGARFAIADEVNKNMKFDIALLKTLSTTSRLTGAHVYEREFTFKSSHLLLIGLDKPPVLEGTRGIRRRLHLIEFRENFPKDQTLLPALIREAPGIMAKLVDGCVAWQKYGLNPPSSVMEASNELTADADIFARWLESRTEYAPDICTPRETLQQSFDAFRRAEHDESPLTASAFTQLFRCDARYDRGARVYVGGERIRSIGGIKLRTQGRGTDGTVNG